MNTISFKLIGAKWQNRILVKLFGNEVNTLVSFVHLFVRDHRNCFSFNGRVQVFLDDSDVYLILLGLDHRRLLVKLQIVHTILSEL